MHFLVLQRCWRLILFKRIVFVLLAFQLMRKTKAIDVGAYKDVHARQMVHPGPLDSCTVFVGDAYLLTTAKDKFNV